MTPSVIAVFVFAACIAGWGAVALLLRDVRCSATTGQKSLPVRLQRFPKLSADRGDAGPVTRFDQWFVRLIRESGLGWTPLTGALLIVLVGAILAAAAFLWKEQPLLAGAGMGIGMAAALAGLVFRRSRRIKRLQEQLPSALDMLARSLRAGQSVDEAFQHAGQRLPEPLATEFRFCANQLAMGLGMPVVMRSLVERVRISDVRIFTTTLAVHRESGGNLAKVLERLAAVVRDRVNYRRQLRAVTGAGRFSALLIAAVGPVLFTYMVFFLPNYLSGVLESSLGQSLFIVAIVLQVIGLVWIARLLRPTY